MDIKLRERLVGVLENLEIRSTFKIPESSFVYMKMDVEGLSFLPTPSGPEGSESIKVQIPEGKTRVVCLNTGKAQFLKLDEKVEIVVLHTKEIIEEGE